MLSHQSIIKQTSMSTHSRLIAYNNSIINQGVIPSMDTYLEEVNRRFKLVDTNFLQTFMKLMNKEKKIGEYCLDVDDFVLFGITPNLSGNKFQNFLERLGLERNTDWIKDNTGEIMTNFESFYICLTKHSSTIPYYGLYLIILQRIIIFYSQMVITLLKLKNTQKDTEYGSSWIVYFIQDDNGYTKIGSTQDLRSELESLRSGNSGYLNVVDMFVTENGRIVTNMICNRLKDKNIKRDWFILSMNEIHTIIYEFTHDCSLA